MFLYPERSEGRARAALQQSGDSGTLRARAQWAGESGERPVTRGPSRIRVNQWPVKSGS